MSHFLFSHSNSLYRIQTSNFRMYSSKNISSIEATRPHRGLDRELKTGHGAKFLSLRSRSSIERMREAVLKVELSTSSYDSAWVAMVPSPKSPEVTCFPECVDWILDNQHPDGSWGLGYGELFLIKDALSSTLACVLALKRWNVGEEQIRSRIDEHNIRLEFISANFSYSMDEQLHSPIGFDIIFPGMIEKAIDMGLNLEVRKIDIDAVLSKRDYELKRGSQNNSEGKKAYLAYVAEGLAQIADWQEVMKYQRKNGSLFNSPSTTAAALKHISDDRAMNYLRSIFQKFGTSVPTVYPLEIYADLCVVDNLEGLGLAEYFSHEIKTILDRVYRCWMKNDEEITLDVVTCAMAFRLLRLNNYDVSSDVLSRFETAEHFSNSVQGYTRDTNAVLQLYKASQAQIFENEHVLKKLNSWSRHFLEEDLSKKPMHGNQAIYTEVEYALRFPFYANMDRLEHKENIEQYTLRNMQTLKTSYTFSNVNGKDLLGLALEVFNASQPIYRKELEYLYSWVKENRLDQLKFTRQEIIASCYLAPAAAVFPPQLSDARICMAKNNLLATYVDDFFDVGGSREEHLNLIALVEKWDINQENQFCSENVKIIFSALYGTINELGTKASLVQKRSVTGYMVNLWRELLSSMMKEVEWQRNKIVPTMAEYISNGYVSFALGVIVLPTLYFLGSELSEEVERGPEYQKLYRLMSTCGRLLNDIQGFEREGKQEKLNSVSLHILHSHGSTSVEEAKKEIRRVIDSSRTELLRLVLATKGSVVPKACKDGFWKGSRICHLFYLNNDGYSLSSEMFGYINAVIKDPLKVTHLCSGNSGDI